MQNETIDKLKNTGYITVTDDSQGIADKVGISGGSSNINGIRIAKETLYDECLFNDFFINLQHISQRHYGSVLFCLPITDPNDENQIIMFFAYAGPISENSVRVALFDNNGHIGEDSIQFNVAIDTDTTDPTVVVSDMEGPEELLSVYGDAIKYALEQVIDEEKVEMMIGESQPITQPDEPEGQ